MHPIAVFASQEQVRVQRGWGPQQMKMPPRSPLRTQSPLEVMQSMRIMRIFSGVHSIVNACARRLGSRASPRTGKEERGFLVRKRKQNSHVWSALKEPPTGGTPHGIGVQLLQAIGGVPQAGEDPRQKILCGGKGWVRRKEARSGSACSRSFSAGSRGELGWSLLEPRNGELIYETSRRGLTVVDLWPDMTVTCEQFLLMEGARNE